MARERETRLDKCRSAGGYIFAVISLLLNVIAFVTPYWLQSWTRVHDKFQRLGLWEVCFNGYSNPHDYSARTYFGCWWIFSTTYDEIRDWLQPPWFIAIQVLSVAILVTHIVSVALLTIDFLKCCSHNGHVMNLFVNTGLQLLSGLIIGIIVLVFGVKVEDRVWMPRPDHNFLSWSYGLYVLCGFFAIFSGIFLIVDAMVERNKSGKEEDRHQTMQMEMAVQSKV